MRAVEKYLKGVGVLYRGSSKAIVAQVKQHTVEQQAGGSEADNSTTNESDKWDNGYKLLRAFQQTEEHCDVPIRHDFQLGKKKTPMTTARIARLELLGFKWNCKLTSDKVWDARFNQLISYKKQKGDCNV